MTEEQYQFFDKLFNNINNSWERFVEAFSCYRMIFNKEQLSKSIQNLLKAISHLNMILNNGAIV